MLGQRLLPALLLVGVILLAACGSGASAAAPPTIRYGVDVSADCGMIISDARFASALVAQSGKAALYDDTGQMAAAVQQSGSGLGTRRAWVHDFDSQGWLDATTAVYVGSEDMKSKTPMGTGVVAFKTRQQGDSFAANHLGKVMTWDELLAQSHA